MREENKDLEPSIVMGNETVKYSDILSMDYCGFRLKALAKKIKSECFKLRKADTHLINP